MNEDSARIHLIWTERNIDLASNSFSFRLGFPNYVSDHVLCAKVEPVLTDTTGNSVEYVNFLDFSIEDDYLSFRIHGGLESFDLNSNDLVTIRVIEPPGNNNHSM